MSQGFKAVGDVLMSRTLAAGAVVTADGVVRWDRNILYGRPYTFSAPKKVLDAALPLSGVWLVWVMVQLNEQEQPMQVLGLAAMDKTSGAKQGLSVSRAECIHLMAQAAKGHCLVSDLPSPLKRCLGRVLERLDVAVWQRTSGAIKAALLV
jgi:hypothetical protein